MTKYSTPNGIVEANNLKAAMKPKPIKKKKKEEKE